MRDEVVEVTSGAVSLTITKCLGGSDVAVTLYPCIRILFGNFIQCPFI